MKFKINSISAVSLLVLLLLPFDPALSAADPQLQVPEGFTIQRAAAQGSVIFPMFACFDDRGHMFVSESSGLGLYAELQKLTHKCRISVLE